MKADELLEENARALSAECRPGGATKEELIQFAHEHHKRKTQEIEDKWSRLFEKVTNAMKEVDKLYTCSPVLTKEMLEDD